MLDSRSFLAPAPVLCFTSFVMHYQAIPTGSFAANAYLLVAADASAAALVDPGADPDRLLAAIAAAGAPLRHILLTHGHPDHASALAPILAAHPEALVLIHPRDLAWLAAPVNTIPPDYPPPAPIPPARLAPWPAPDADFPFPVAGARCRPLHVPGHTPGGIAYLFPDDALLLTGDTLFRESVGRTDLPGGSARELAASLRLLARLDDSLTILPGHGDSSTLRHELAYNYFLQNLNRA